MEPLRVMRGHSGSPTDTRGHEGWSSGRNYNCSPTQGIPSGGEKERMVGQTESRLVEGCEKRRK